MIALRKRFFILPSLASLSEAAWSEVRTTTSELQGETAMSLLLAYDTFEVHLGRWYEFID